MRRRSRRKVTPDWWYATKMFVIMLVLTILCCIVGSACSEPVEASDAYKRMVLEEEGYGKSQDRYYLFTDSKTDKSYFIFVTSGDASRPLYIELEDN